MNAAMKLSLFAFALVLSPLAAGCFHGPRAELTPPSDFASMDDPHGYDWRAASARGVVLATRTEPNDLRANVDFWAQSIDLRLQRDGYAPDGVPRDVTSASGVRGRQLRYTRAEGDRRTYRYWLTLFVDGARVTLVEAGGDQEVFDPARPEVERAVLTVRSL